MKKRCIVLIAASMLLMGGSVYATDLATGGVSAAGVEIKGQRTGGTVQSLGKLSNNVKLGATYNKDTYAFDTKHDSGTKQYGSSAGDTKLYYLDVAKTFVLTAPNASDSTAFTSWTAL